jgi:hypothetical protein
VLRLLAANEKRRQADKRRIAAMTLLAEAVQAGADAAELHLDADHEQEEALRQVILPDMPPAMPDCATS